MPEHWYPVPSVALNCWLRPKSHQKPFQFLPSYAIPGYSLGVGTSLHLVLTAVLEAVPPPTPPPFLEGGFSGRDVSCSKASGLSAVEGSKLWPVHICSHGARCAVMGTLLDSSLRLPSGEGFYLFINFPSEKRLGRSQYISTVKSWVSYCWFAQICIYSVWRPAMIFFHLISSVWISPEKSAMRQCLSAHVLWLSGFSWPAQGALWSSSSAGSMCALSWGTHLLWVCKLVFSDCYHTALPPHPLCSVSSQSSWVCAAAVKWALPSSCSPCAQWSQIGSFKMVPPFGCFFTSLTVSHSWCYYFVAPTDWNILWCFKEPLFHCKVPQFQWLAMYFK